MPTTISAIVIDLVRVPLRQALGNHPFLGQRTQFVTLLVRIRTSDGAEGFGYVTADSERQMRAVAEIVQDVADRLIGDDALDRGRILRKAWGLTAELLHEGAAHMAIATLDIALWDLLGRHTGLPLAKLVGARHGDVRIYASHGLWRHLGRDELAADGCRLVDEGFRAVKLRLQAKSVKDDIERARILREAVGPDIVILTDALWGYAPLDAARLSSGLAEYGVAWLEDPVSEDNIAGLVHVRGARGTPVAAGERISRLSQLEQFLAADAIDHLILDVHHLGGISPWLKAATLAEANGMPISAHIAYEIQLPLVAATSVPGWLEYFPFWDVLYRNPPDHSDGRMATLTTPGLGLDLDAEAIERLRC